MNFHMPIDNKVVQEYVDYLNSFTFDTVPDSHREAWKAMSYLKSNYHKTANKTAELAIVFYRGLQAYREA